MKRLKQNKLFIFLTIITIISFVLGIFYIAVLSKSNQELIRTSISSYFNSKSNLNIYNVLLKNILIDTIIFLLGISIIAVPLVSLILIIRTFITSFTFTSIIYTYGFKGIVRSFIYSSCGFINLFICFIITYYSISFSIIIFRYLFNRKDYNQKYITKRYLSVYGLTIIFTIITSLIEVYLVPLFL